MVLVSVGDGLFLDLDEVTAIDEDDGIVDVEIAGCTSEYEDEEVCRRLLDAWANYDELRGGGEVKVIT